MTSGVREPGSGARSDGRVLVVEDDGNVRAALEHGLRLHGFDVVLAADAESGLPLVATNQPQLLVIDIGLPGMSGIELCRRLRERLVEIPILILSARDQVGDRVAGLRAGADDYLVKPFALDELVARLEALRRRGLRPLELTRVLSAGPLWMDLDRRLARSGEVELELTRREFDLLAVFVANHGIVLSRIRLLELVWGYDFDVDTNVVDVFIGYLRRKLDSAGSPGLIVTVRGIGFQLRDR
ncbi:MAG: response regulator transcription factor [Nocardioides sp.]